MMRTQNGRISRQVVKIVHDNSHKQVQHDERAKEDEADEVEVSEDGSTVLLLIFW